MLKLILGAWLMIQPVNYDFSRDGEIWRIPHVQAPSAQASCESERLAHVELRRTLFLMIEADVQVVTLRREGDTRWIALKDRHSGADMVELLVREDLLRPMGAARWCE